MFCNVVATRVVHNVQVKLDCYGFVNVGRTATVVRLGRYVLVRYLADDIIDNHNINMFCFTIS